MMPNGNQFSSLVRDEISENGHKSLGYKAVYDLFQASERIYKALDSCTSEGLAVFKSAGCYLTPQQERDAVALAVLCIMALNNGELYSRVNQDPDLLPEEKTILKMALKSFSDTIQATHHALGLPRWVP